MPRQARSNLFGDGRILLEREQVHRVRSSVERGRVGCGGEVQPGVDQDPLLVGLDQVGRDGEADRLVSGSPRRMIPAGAVNLPAMSSRRRKVVFAAFEHIQILGVVGPAEVLDAATQVLGGEEGYDLSIATLDGRPVRCSIGHAPAGRRRARARQATQR